MTTNAQTALQAAATAFQGRMKANIASEVLGLAEQYKAWLDKQEPVEKPEPVELSHHITCASRMQFRDKPHERPCDCNPVPYEEPTKTAANLPPFSEQPGPDPTFRKGTPVSLKPKVNRWTLRMWNRNIKSPAVKVEVMAKDKKEALSKALSLCPGHAWDNLTDTGEVWEEVAPNQYRRAAE